MQGMQGIPSGLDLNKPLPPSPSASTISFNSMSSKSRYSEDMQVSTGFHECEEMGSPENVDPAPQHGYSAQTQSNDLQVESVINVSQFNLPGYPKAQPPQYGSSSRLSLPAINVKALEPTQIEPSKPEFKALGYDQVDERPIIFYPQGSLIDLAEHKKIKKTSIANLFKKVSQRVQKGGIRPEEMRERAPPPRPPRPSRHLCPSPPYNPANMPQWRGETINQMDLAENLESAKLGNQKKEHTELLAERSQQAPTSMLPKMIRPMRKRGDNFVNRLDLYHGAENHYSTRTSADAATEQSSSNLQAVRPHSLEGSHDSSSDHQLCQDRSAETVGPTKMLRENTKSLRTTGSGTLKTGHRRATITELEHVPEDASLHSFCDNRNSDPKDSRRSNSSSASTSLSPGRSATGPLHCFSRSKSRDVGIDLVTQLDVEDKDIRQGRERVKSISCTLRTQFQQEWEERYGESLRNSESLITSCSTTDAFPKCQRTERISDYTHQDDVRDDSLNVPLRWEGRRSDFENPEVSATLARLAELCTPSESHDNPSGIPWTSMYGEVSEVCEYGVDLSSLIPPPLVTERSARGVYGEQSDTDWETAGSLQKHSQEQHDSITSSSSALQSHKRRIFSDSNFDGSFVNTPVTEFGEWMYEAQSRSPSPLLPISPLPPQPRVHHPSFPLDISTQMSNLAQISSATWDLRRVRSALRLNRALSTETKAPPRPRRSRSISFTTLRASSLSQYTDCTIEEESEDEMYYHQNRGQSRARVPRAIPERSRSPSPPPVPSRSSRRPIPQPQNPHLSMTKAELNGVADVSPSLSRSGSQTSSRGSDDEKSRSGSGASTPVLRESIIPQKVYGPFRQMSYRGRSVMYHVNAQGEYTF